MYTHDIFGSDTRDYLSLRRVAKIINVIML